MILSTLCWVVGIIYGLVFLTILIRTIRNEGKDPAFKVFLENGMDYSKMYGLTKGDKEHYDRFKKKVYVLLFLGFISFILIVLNDVLDL